MGLLERALAAAVVCCWLSGCFFYDSSWGQAKASQKRVAASRMPGQLGSEPHSTRLRREDAVSGPVTQLRLRAYATPHYAAALVDAEAQLAQTLQDANPELARGLGIRLELVDYRVSASRMADDDLSALLAAIAKEDPAADVDWVLVLASPRNMVALGPDELGVGEVLGRHLAIRAMSDAAEYDWIQQSFDELSEEEKAKLYAARKRHKSATVLLHEVGHTLGMPHELAEHSLMNPRYDSQSTAFSPLAARLGRRALELRATSPGSSLFRQSAQAALNVLQSAPEHTWVPDSQADVQRVLERYAQAAFREPAATGRAAAAPAPANSSTTQLNLADRALLERARQEQAAGHIVEARSLAKALFEAYPRSLQVQELRCQLAMKAQLPMAEEQDECRPLMQLSGTAF